MILRSLGTMSVIAVVAIILASSNSITTTVVHAATVKTYDATTVFTQMDVIRICTPAAGAKICYKNIFGNFYFSCTAASNEVLMYKCTDAACSTGCVLLRTFVTGTPLQSDIEGTRTYNWSGVVYTSTAGYISQLTYGTAALACQASDIEYANYHPDSATACLQFPNYLKSSVRWSCTAGNPVYQHFLDASTCTGTSATTTHTSGQCFNGNLTSWNCVTPGGTLNIVLFEKSSAGGLMCRLVVVMMVLVLML